MSEQLKKNAHIILNLFTLKQIGLNSLFTWKTISLNCGDIVALKNHGFLTVIYHFAQMYIYLLKTICIPSLENTV